MSKIHGMKLQFSIARLMRSTAFFAVGWWMLIWMWGLFHGSGSYPHMFWWAFFLVPAFIGGAIGALFGKTPHGVFYGFVVAVATIFVGMIFLLATGLPIL